MRRPTPLHILRLLLAAAFGVATLLVATPTKCWASGHEGGHEAAAEEPEEEAAPDAECGVNLGEFDIRSYRTVPSQRVRVRFTLFATVTGKEYKQFAHLFEGRKSKAREQVLIAARLMTVEDYDDPDLAKLRRRILLRLRRTMPELAIDDVVVSEFSLSVQGT
jgi:hypothetical protein